MRVRAIVFVAVLSASLFASLTPFISTPYGVGVVDQDCVPKDAIHIKTATQLATIKGRNSAGKYYVLDNDINLVDEWVPIEDFRGTFDGQGYSINNLYVLTSSNRQHAGLFGQIDADNVTIKNTVINIHSNGLTANNDDADAYAGGLIGEIYRGAFVSVVNCSVIGNITAISSSFTAAGGLIGGSRFFKNVDSLSVVNCSVIGDITATGSGETWAGGLIGGSIFSYLGGSVVIMDSYTTSDVTAISGSRAAWAGGLIGYSDVGVIVVNSYATGNVNTVSSYSAAGGLIGYNFGASVERNSLNTTVENSYATGNITIKGTSTIYAGGLIGYYLGGVAIVKNSYAIGDITAITTSNGMATAGGLIGTGSVNITNSYATGDITATSASGDSCAGGLVGFSNRSPLTIEKCYATGDVTATSDLSVVAAYAGGLVGYIEPALVIKSCYRLSTQKIIGDKTNKMGTPRTPTAMKIQWTFIGWNFKTTWAINSNVNGGYPYLTMGLITSDDWGLFGSFYFTVLITIVVLVMIAGVVYALLQKRRYSVVRVKG